MDQQVKKDEIESREEESLDSLLDDALEDFNKPVAPNKHEGSVSDGAAAPTSTNEWTEEFISAATKNFEATMKTFMNQKENSVPGCEEVPAGAVDMGAISADFAKFAEAAAKAATDTSSDKNFTQCLADALQQVAQNKEEAETIPSSDDLSKMLSSLGLGDNGAEVTNELGGLFPLMQSMLENILSKDILYPPLKEIVAKYPDWLADNRSRLPDEEYNRYNKQYDIMKQVVEKFEEESDNEVEKSKTSENILLLMQSLQEFGQPPQELVGNYDPLVTTDEKGNPMLPDLGALLQGVGFPSMGAGETPPTSLSTANEQDNSQSHSEGSEECILM